jgi:hypothetical protein
MAINDYTWTARVNWIAGQEAKAFARNHAFTVGQPVSFDTADSHLSAVEYLLGALGGDLVNGFQAQARRSRVTIDAIEMRLSGRLNNVLTHLGVIGETGHPGFEAIDGTLYVSAEADEPSLLTLWHTTLERSPLVNTLQQCVALTLNLKVM